ncbi:hypothetical protein PS938_02252 [Pseudomonas fluorescens]|uniref:Uncharacterized protein n=1 Tax=Pseudomonas fluorescens TaxID=294 RepID=A0A5E7TS46_PSEFL|nr:hypothetical protein PS938_02252 [Pseudomonas fluorescens]
MIANCANTVMTIAAMLKHLPKSENDKGDRNG